MKTLSKLFIIPLALLGSVATVNADSRTHTENTDSSGTSVTVDKSHQDSTNMLGTHTEKTDIERETDPKGLNNKTKETYHAEESTKPNGDRSAEVSGVDANGTAVKNTDSEKTRAHWDGSKTTTETHTRVVDPKGLGNKSETETTNEVTHNADGSTTTKRKVNGETTSETTVAH